MREDVTILISNLSDNLNFSKPKTFLRPLPSRGGDTKVNIAKYVLQASQSPYSIIVYCVANYRPHLSHFWANVIVAIPT